MRWTLLAALALTGCGSVQGPRAVRGKGPADAPGYTIEEQHQRGRDRYTMPIDDYRVGPSTQMGYPDPVGRY
jgi:hypothetical protein